MTSTLTVASIVCLNCDATVERTGPAQKRCALCASIHNRERRVVRSAAWYVANRARVAVAGAERYAANPEFKAAYRAANRERKVAYDAAYNAANPERKAAHRHKRRARERDAPGDGVTARQWAEILAAQPWCHYCGDTTVELVQEHMTPLSRGGAHDVSNVTPACAPCNNRKHTKTADEFLS